MYFLDQCVIVEELHIIRSFYQSLLNTEKVPANYLFSKNECFIEMSINDFLKKPIF